MIGWAMKLIFCPCLLWVIAVAIVVRANECALNSECIPIADCPFIRDNFNLIKRKPYCNLKGHGANVCCRKSSQNYTQPKYDGLPVARECKSYDSLPSLEKPLREGCHYESNIVGRVRAEPKEFPFVAMIYRKVGSKFIKFCVGTLISKMYVLTSADCFVYGENPNLVRLGELDYGTGTDDALTQDIEIKNIIAHHRYSATELLVYHDIALIELAKEAIFNDYVRPACLSLADDNDFQQFVSVDWPFSSHLHKMNLNRLDYDKCFEIFWRDRHEEGLNNRTKMCVIGACDVHDGSPLFVRHPEFPCQFILVGIKSFGYTDCGNKPTVYTRVKLYIDWIQRIVWN
ncbi:serine protease snk-like [Glossina fuscipes fuscipes]